MAEIISGSRYMKIGQIKTSGQGFHVVEKYEGMKQALHGLIEIVESELRQVMRIANLDEVRVLERAK